VAAHARRPADVRPVPRRRGGAEARRAPGAAAVHPRGHAPAGDLRRGHLPRPAGAGTALARPAPARHRRAARPGRAAAGDPVHLQPGRLRRRRPAVPARRAAADRARRAGRDPRGGRGAHPAHPQRRPAGAGVLGMARRP
jgi:hypothetical protein